MREIPGSWVWDGYIWKWRLVFEVVGLNGFVDIFIENYSIWSHNTMEINTIRDHVPLFEEYLDDINYFVASSKSPVIPCTGHSLEFLHYNPSRLSTFWGKGMPNDVAAAVTYSIYVRGTASCKMQIHTSNLHSRHTLYHWVLTCTSFYLSWRRKRTSCLALALISN